MMTRDLSLDDTIRPFRTVLAVAMLVLLSGCITLGPDYVRPEVKVQQEWIDAGKAGFTVKTPDNDGRWWTLFNDPDLDRLIELCYQQNLTLQTAGLRILEARAQLGIAVGQLYPQQQQATANASRGIDVSIPLRKPFNAFIGRIGIISMRLR